MDARTVCIVDDDQALRHALAFEMSTQGYTVQQFPDAEAALDSPDLSPSACLVVDQRLPRLDGLFLIEALRARGAAARAILITSNPARSLSRRCTSLGIPLIEKPLIEDDLSAAVQRAFSAAR